MRSDKLAAARTAVKEGAERIAPRYKVFELTSMKCASGEHRIHLINVSATGAMVHFDGAPCIGSIISLRVGDTSTCAKIVWVRGPRFGISFLRRLKRTGYCDLTGALSLTESRNASLGDSLGGVL